MTAVPKPAPRTREPKRLATRVHVIADAIKQRVFTRDNWTCQWCLQPGGALDAHHRLRRSQGGKDEYDNLVSVHRKCHRQIHEHPQEARRRGFLVRRAQGE